METLISPSILFWFTCVFLCIGIVILVFGNSLPARGSWLVFGGMVLLLTGVGLDSGLTFNQEVKTKVWHTGWILMRGDAQAVTVGILQDLLSYAVLVVSILMSLALVLNGSFFKDEHPERAMAGLVIAVSGVAFSSIGLTPWIVLGGESLTFFGGVVGFGALGGKQAEAQLITKFLWERSSSFIIAIVGACILVASGHGLLLNQSELWVAVPNSTLGSPETGTYLGAILLCSGLFLQMQPFAYMGWMSLSSRTDLSKRLLLLQILPAIGAFILLLRLEPQLVSLGVFPDFGWVALFLSMLAILSAVFQESWRFALKLWLSAGFSMACGLLALGGRQPAFATFLSVSLAALAQANIGVSLDLVPAQGSDVEAMGQKNIWAKVLLFTAAGSGTGFIGFLSAVGAPLWIAKTVDLSGVMAPFLVLYFLFVFLGWRFSWGMMRLAVSPRTLWATVCSSLAWILMSLALCWTGTATGGFMGESADRLFPSFFVHLFGKQFSISDSSDFLPFSGIYWGSLLFAVSASYWVYGQKEDRRALWVKKLPRFTRVFTQGYGLAVGAQRVGLGLEWIGARTQLFVGEKIWKVWIPVGTSLVINKVSHQFSSIDRNISLVIKEVLRVLVEVPGKTLQLIQMGDLRWYLFLSLALGFSLIGHYFKS